MTDGGECVAWWGAAAAHDGTVAGLAARAGARHGGRVAVRYRGAELTYAELAARVEAAARGLIACGVEPGDRVAVWAANHPEWVVVDLAVAAVGAVAVPIYSTSAPAEAEFVVADAGARVVACDDPAAAAALADRGGAQGVERVVAIGDRADAEGWPAATLTLGALAARGEVVPVAAVARRTNAVVPGDVYRVIYTSGTTGRPKGCPLTHANVCAAVAMRAAADPVGPRDSFFLFLPLAHAYGLAIQVLALSYGATAIHAVGSMDALVDQLAAAGPTHLLGVPRFAEKLYARATAGLAPEEVAAAVAAAESAAALAAAGQTPPAALAARIAELERGLLADVRALTGGRLRRATIGAAPVAVDTLRLFHAAGVPMVQGYGMTETSGFAALSTPADHRLGAVGRPLPGLDVRIAADGEILLRGPNVFAGYSSGADGDFGALDGDGWLATGDRGRIGPDGLLEITGRIKDLIVTAGGKNIAPEGIERDLTRSPFIDQAVVLGDGRPFPVALIALDSAAVARWARERGVEPAEPASAHAAEELRELVQGEIDAVNAAYARPEQIKAFALLEAPLTAAAGELTASQKIRRAVVAERHAELVDALYAAPARGGPG
ncbi:MAG: long-chain fatty acid--CoA ligase [Solirubrobacterales bacterium]|nr:long-chain fatty acid--CoA ligase [Solirubrobacterales bacterium]